MLAGSNHRAREVGVAERARIATYIRDWPEAELQGARAEFDIRHAQKQKKLHWKGVILLRVICPRTITRHLLRQRPSSSELLNKNYQS